MIVSGRTGEVPVTRPKSRKARVPGFARPPAWFLLLLAMLAGALSLTVAASERSVRATPRGASGLPSVRLIQDSGATPTPARSFEWSRIDVTLDVGESGEVHVTERLEVSFQGGPFRSGFRDIPLDRDEHIRNVQVAEERDGQVIALQEVDSPIDRETPDTFVGHLPNGSGEARIEWAFSPTSDATRVFVLEYDFDGAVQPISATSHRILELSWIAVGRDLSESGPVQEATVSVHLPNTVDASRTEGLARFARQQPVISEDRRTWTWSVSDLLPGDELFIRMRLPLR